MDKLFNECDNCESTCGYEKGCPHENKPHAHKDDGSIILLCKWCSAAENQMPRGLTCAHTIEKY